LSATTNITEPGNVMPNMDTRQVRVALLSREHSYATIISPRAVKHKMTSAVDRGKTLQKKLKSSSTKAHCLKKKCQSLSEVIKISRKAA